MQRILDTVELPSGGWYFVVPETGVTIHGPTLRQLQASVQQHYDANNIQPAVPADILVEEQICARLAPNKCRQDETPPPTMSTRITLEQLVSGTLTLSHFLIKGKPFVPQEMANARARICSNCQYNVQESHGCVGCSSAKIRSMVEEIVGPNVQTEYDNHLHACVACGCALKVSVWVPLEIQQAHLPSGANDKLPDYCWKKKQVKYERNTKSKPAPTPSAGGGRKSTKATGCCGGRRN